MVEVTFADGSKTRFTTPSSDIFSLFPLGSQVKVLTMRFERAGKVYDTYEIDDPFHLWLGDALEGACVLFMFIGFPVLFFFQPLSRLRDFINRRNQKDEADFSY